MTKTWLKNRERFYLLLAEKQLPKKKILDVLYDEKVSMNHLTIVFVKKHHKVLKELHNKLLEIRSSLVEGISYTQAVRGMLRDGRY